jgi:uncharacterized ion transporter superfamily protein YfcC
MRAMKLKAPNAFVLIFGIMVGMACLSWVIPGGEYARVEKEIEGLGTRMVVDPDRFEEVEAVGQGAFALIQAPIKGAEHAAETLAFILLIGGAFGVLQATGALMAGLKWLTLRARGSGRFLMIPILMMAFSAGGVLFGMAEETLVFVLLTVPLSVSLGFDTITGIAIPFVGSQAGFATAFVNPFSFGIAKSIAEQPLDEGQGYRVMCWLVVTGVCIAFVTWHAWRVSKDPGRSLTPELDASWRQKVAEEDAGRDSSDAVVTGPQFFTLLVFAACMVWLGYGSIALGWYVTEISGVFIGMAIVCGIAGRLAPGKMADAFMQGARDLCGTAVLVAFSRAILVLAEDAHIIDTMLHSVAGAMEGQSSGFGVQCMYVVQSTLNFLIPSGSGQAALTMPIMTPLADLLHIHRENAVLAFQFGDGFTNMIIPTNPVCIGVIGAAGLGYGTWFRWMLKWQVILFIVGAVLLSLSPFTGS